MHLLWCMMYGKLSLTFSSAILMPRLNLFCTSKGEMVLDNLTSTVGLVTTVTPPSIMLLVQAQLMVRQFKKKKKKLQTEWTQNFTNANKYCKQVTIACIDAEVRILIPDRNFN